MLRPEQTSPSMSQTSTSTLDTEKIIYNWSSTLAEVMNLAVQKHVDLEHIERAMIKAIDSFCTTLDPHSSFLDPKTYKSMLESTSGEFYGIGIVIDNTRKSKDKHLLVIDVTPDGPADKVGVKPLDKIIEADGKSFENLATEELIAMLRGERGSKVTIKVIREGQPDLLTFEITRDVVKEQNSLSFHIKDHNICYLALTTFNENSARQLEQLLANVHKKNYKGLILDLRNNSGGLLSSVIEIAGLFLPKGSLVVITKDRHGKEIERYVTTRDPIAPTTIPIFILVNNYTASAAEILAGFLKTHADQTAASQKCPQSLVFILGSKTFGKGSVQEVRPVSNNCAVKITTSLYYLPDGSTIQGTGIEPDFVVDRMLPATEQMQWFTKYYGHEKNLENYIKPKDAPAEQKFSEASKQSEQKNAKDRWAQRARQLLETDNQLREAIMLINMLNSASKQCAKIIENRKTALEFLSPLTSSRGVPQLEPLS